jgi:predicted GIY-YIG superfamily endonuclease
VTGTVYLLHFDRPYKHAKHYTGWTDDLGARLAQHAASNGARLLAVVHAAGIGWQLARTWPGGRARERQIKRQGGASRYCPMCGVKPRPAHAAVAAAGPDDCGWAYTCALEELAAEMWRRVHESLAAAPMCVEARQAQYEADVAAAGLAESGNGEAC